MIKYEKFNYSDNDINSVISADENILFDLKPKKNLYFVNRVINIMPIIIINLIFDIYMIVSVINNDFFSNVFLIFLFFIICRGLLLFLWVRNVLYYNKKWSNTRYYITDKRIIIKNGLVNREYRFVSYYDIVNINLKVNIFEKLLKVGNIYFDVLGSISDGNNDTAFLDIENYRDIYDSLKSAVSDAHSIEK